MLAVLLPADRVSMDWSPFCADNTNLDINNNNTLSFRSFLSVMRSWLTAARWPEGHSSSVCQVRMMKALGRTALFCLFCSLAAAEGDTRAAPHHARAVKITHCVPIPDQYRGASRQTSPLCERSSHLTIALAVIISSNYGSVPVCVQRLAYLLIYLFADHSSNPALMKSLKRVSFTRQPCIFCKTDQHHYKTHTESIDQTKHVMHYNGVHNTFWYT